MYNEKTLFYLFFVLSVATFFACSSDDDKEHINVPTIAELESNSASYIKHVRNGVEAYLYFYNNKLYYGVSAGVPTPPYIFDCQVNNGTLHLSRTLNNGSLESHNINILMKTKGNAKTLTLEYAQGEASESKILYDGDYEYNKESLRHVFIQH